MDLGFLSDAWGGIQEAWGYVAGAYDWWTSEGPGAGANPPPVTPPAGYGGSPGGSSQFPWLLLIVAGVIAFLIFKK